MKFVWMSGSRRGACVLESSPLWCSHAPSRVWVNIVCRALDGQPPGPVSARCPRLSRRPGGVAGPGRAPLPADRQGPAGILPRPAMWVSAAARAVRRDPIGRTPRMARVKVPGGFSGKAAYMGAGVGESSHRACALDASGRKLPGRAVANDEADIRGAARGRPGRGRPEGEHGGARAAHGALLRLPSRLPARQGRARPRPAPPFRAAAHRRVPRPRAPRPFRDGGGRPAVAEHRCSLTNPWSAVIAGGPSRGSRHRSGRPPGPPAARRTARTGPPTVWVLPVSTSPAGTRSLRLLKKASDPDPGSAPMPST